MQVHDDNRAGPTSAATPSSKRPLLNDLGRVFNAKSISAGVVAALFGCSGPA